MNTNFQGSTEKGKDEWLTPPELVTSIGDFDLDPCQPVNPPFTHAKKGYNILDNGLLQKWEGRVFCNPPYGNECGKWLKKCADHGNAVALVFARTETDMFFRHVWNKASGIIFIKGRIKFIEWNVKNIIPGLFNTKNDVSVNGVLGTSKSNAGAPSVLISYGIECADLLEKTNIPGKFLRL